MLETLIFAKLAFLALKIAKLTFGNINFAKLKFFTALPIYIQYTIDYRKFIKKR